MIRAAHTDDLAQFAQWSDGSPDCQFSQAQLSGYLVQDRLIAIVEQGGSLAGYLAYRQVLDEAELDQILIAPSARRLGLAFDALLTWHEALKAQGVVSVHLEVRQGNQAAMSLYQSAGYDPNGLRKNYYRHGTTVDHAVLMKKSL
ncbi:GNAT family N-acetyltransferase [Reinekea blandensis]|uniref:Putative acetyltransferase n=1 Tax=Reinekea blandensis MED297 TaxID=314283 RepID=A4BK29_9GAMM|nr:GNAT family N-acetyltransferase [Reinekea blandensis]EAR07511.1 putative acetyltransferase [Reinekea sp. MED297] [Reinekea blandensis MED297]